MIESFARTILQRIDWPGKNGRRTITAIDGRCASGKTTLALEIRRLTGCAVFHMDDFFLRPEQRTRERLKTPGGNVDHERFLEEVLLPLSRGAETIRFRPFDCRSMSLMPEESVRVGGLAVVEGSYSCCKELFPYYDLRVFLTVPREEQLRRLSLREGESGFRAFADKWIPLEESYFQNCDIEARCDMRFGCGE